MDTPTHFQPLGEATAREKVTRTAFENNKLEKRLYRQVGRTIVE